MTLTAAQLRTRIRETLLDANKANDLIAANTTPINLAGLVVAHAIDPWAFERLSNLLAKIQARSLEDVETDAALPVSTPAAQHG
jgi:hypothetical protein